MNRQESLIFVLVWLAMIIIMSMVYNALGPTRGTSIAFILALMFGILMITLFNVRR